MKCMPAKQGFLGLDNDYAVTYEDADVVVIPFGLEATVSYGSGTAKGPAAMINASHNIELFDEQLWCEPVSKIGIATAEEPKITDQQEPALAQLEQIVETVLKDNKFPMVFGGEHAITAGAIRPFAQRYDDLVILHFDAHADLRDSYEGAPYSHASALRRCLDHDHVSVVSVGIRSISSEEIPFLQSQRERIHIYWAKDKARWNIEEMMAHLSNRPIYLTFDIDGFDASLMPATGTPEPGGLFWNETIEIITAASQAGNIVGADVNELAPIEALHSCDFLAAKLAYKIIALALSQRN